MLEQYQAVRRRGPEKIAGTAEARLRAVQRFGQLGTAQRAAGHEQQRHQAARITFGAIVPDVVARGDHLQTRARCWALGAVGISGRTGSRRRERRCHDGSRSAVSSTRRVTPELDQVQRRPVGQVDRGDQLGHDAQLGRKRPRLGHAAQHQVAGWIRLELVAFDDVDECRLGNVGLDRPAAVRQVPAQRARRARAGQHQARVSEHVDERLGADGEAAQDAAAAQARQELDQGVLQADAPGRASDRDRTGARRRDRERPASPLANARTAQALLGLSGWPTGGQAQTTLEACQADAHAARAVADVVEVALLDQRVDARAADAETTGGLAGETPISSAGSSERASASAGGRNGRFGVHSGCGKC